MTVLGGGAFRRWLGHEVIRSQGDEHLLKKGTREIFHPFNHMRTKQKHSVYEPESGPSPASEYAGAMILAFLAP